MYTHYKVMSAQLSNCISLFLDNLQFPFTSYTSWYISLAAMLTKREEKFKHKLIGSLLNAKVLVYCELNTG